MSNSSSVNEQREADHGTTKSYVMGFGLSLLFTLSAYLIVTKQLVSGLGLIAIIIGLAAMQLLAQLVFFLHLGKESRPRWNVTVFLFMVVVLVILVIGTLWIMSNLNYHVMSPNDANTYILEEEGIQK